MDTSNFSLSNAYRTIKPFKDHLSFSPLSSFFEEKGVFDSVRYEFTIWPKVITSPLHVTGEIRVFPAVRLNGPSFNLTDSRCTSRTLFCCQDGHEYEWLYMETNYNSRSRVPFWSVSGSIVHVNDENFRRVVKPSDNFESVFWEGIVAWVKLSIDRRESYLRGLKDFHADLVGKTYTPV